MAAGNRSVPADTVLPHVVFQNLPQAPAWLNRAFGFEERDRYGDPPSGAQLRAGRAAIQVRQAPAGQQSPAQDGHHWLFSRHARDRSPEEWGAVVKTPD